MGKVIEALAAIAMVAGILAAISVCLAGVSDRVTEPVVRELIKLNSRISFFDGALQWWLLSVGLMIVKRLREVAEALQAKA